MKKTILLAILIINFIITGASQNLRGGFGHAYFGLGYNYAPHIQKDLQASSLLGDNLQLNKITNFAGGGGYAVLGNRIMIGGSGFGYKVADATARGEATLSMGGGFINLGYLTTIRRNMLAFPYIGIGGNGMKLKIKNNTSGDSFTIDGNNVAPGQYINLHAGGVSFEAGYALKFLTFSVSEEKGGGGFMVGIEAGSYFFAGLEDWHKEPSRDMMSTMSKGYAMSPYLRITIGGGGFSIRN